MNAAVDGVESALTSVAKILEDVHAQLSVQFVERFSNAANPMDLSERIIQLQKDVDKLRAEATIIQSKQEDWNRELTPLIVQSEQLGQQLQQLHHIEKETENQAPDPAKTNPDRTLGQRDPLVSTRNRLPSRRQ